MPRELNYLPRRIHWRVEDTAKAAEDFAKKAEPMPRVESIGWPIALQQRVGTCRFSWPLACPVSELKGVPAASTFALKTRSRRIGTRSESERYDEECSWRPLDLELNGGSWGRVSAQIIEPKLKIVFVVP